MDEASLNSAAVLHDLATGDAVAVTSSYDAASQTLSIKPSTGLLIPSHYYQLDIASNLPDTFGFTTKDGFSAKFVTALDPNQQTKVYSPLDTTKTNFVTATKGVFNPGSFVILRTSFIEPTGPVTAAAAAVDSAMNSNKNLRIQRQVEVLFYNTVNNQPVQGTAPSSVPLTLAVPGTAAAPALHASSLSSNNIDVGSLTIYQYVAGQGLVAVKGAVNNGDGTVTANVNKSGVYVLAGSISTTLSGAYAYPVPYKPSAGHTVITFTGLATDSTVKIYTIMGELVKTLDTPDANGNIIWTVKNTDGDNVASGVYIYQIKNSFDEKRGKLMIIR